MTRALQPHLEQIWDRGACSSHRQIPRHSERRCTTCYSVQAPWLMRSEKLRRTLCGILPRPPRSMFWACTLRNARTAAIRRTSLSECTQSQTPFLRMRSASCRCPMLIMGRSEFSIASDATLGTTVSWVSSAPHTRMRTLNALANATRVQWSPYVPCSLIWAK